MRTILGASHCLVVPLHCPVQEPIFVKIYSDESDVRHIFTYEPTSNNFGCCFYSLCNEVRSCISTSEFVGSSIRRIYQPIAGNNIETKQIPSNSNVDADAVVNSRGELRTKYSALLERIASAE